MTKESEMELLPMGSDGGGNDDAVGNSVLSDGLNHTSQYHTQQYDTDSKVSYFYHSKPPVSFGLPSAPKMKLGTMSGVYIPTMNSIFGVVIFLRWGWAVGNAGLLQCFVILIVGCTVAMVTTLSVSAISTNEEVRAGGAYYMISRSLGPAFGASMGLLFYIAQALGVTFYILGFSETVRDKANFHHFPVAGSLDINLLLIAIASMVSVLGLALLGSSFFAKVGTFILAGIVFSLVFALLSAWVQPVTDSLLDSGFTGMKPSTLSANFGPDYDEGNGFLHVFSVVYPSMTAILTGANMSGVLANPGKAIPAGTFASIVTMAVSYGLVIVTLAASVMREHLKKNFYILQTVCYVHDFVLIGNLLATYSSALSGFVGVSRVLQAMCLDKVLGHKLSYFGEEVKVLTERMPVRAMILTFFISSAILFLGDVNTVAPLLSNFLLITFAVLNFAAMILDVSHTPNYRPTFKQCNWKVSAFGTFLCLATMFMMEWITASISILIAAGAFVFVMRHPPPVKWGSPAQAVLYRVAMTYLMRLDARKQSVKYWRPQVLAVFPHVNPVKSKGLAEFASDCKKRGVLVAGHVLLGHPNTALVAKREAVLNRLRTMLEDNFIAGFSEVVIAPSLEAGVVSLLQIAGLGAMKPNTLVTGLPDVDSRKSAKNEALIDWFKAVRSSLALGVNVIVACGFTGYDKAAAMKSMQVRQTQCTIDVWFTGTGDYAEMRELFTGRTMVMLQLAYLYSLNRFWLTNASLRIVLMLPGKTHEDVKEDVESFRELMTLARLTAPIKVVCTNEAAEVMSTLGIKSERQTLNESKAPPPSYLSKSSTAAKKQPTAKPAAASAELDLDFLSELGPGQQLQQQAAAEEEEEHHDDEGDEQGPHENGVGVNEDDDEDGVPEVDEEEPYDEAAEQKIQETMHDLEVDSNMPTTADFDSLAPTQRKRVLNQLLKRHSSDAAVIFVQESNTALHYQKGKIGALRYVADQRILSQGLCPVACISPCDTLVDQRIGEDLGSQ